MSQKIGLHIGGRRFDVDVDDKFAVFLKQKMAQDFNVDGNNDLKLLLQAYVRKNHELFLNEKLVRETIKKIDSE